jgi:hypothetical protein
MSKVEVDLGQTNFILFVFFFSVLGTVHLEACSWVRMPMQVKIKESSQKLSNASKGKSFSNRVRRGCTHVVCHVADD